MELLVVVKNINSYNFVYSGVGNSLIDMDYDSLSYDTAYQEVEDTGKSVNDKFDEL